LGRSCGMRLEWLISISSESAGARLIAINRCVVYEAEQRSNNERSINHPIFSSPHSRKLRISSPGVCNKSLPGINPSRARVAFGLCFVPLRRSQHTPSTSIDSDQRSGLCGCWWALDIEGMVSRRLIACWCIVVGVVASL